MAKKEKIIELKQRVEKISDEHLGQLQDIVNRLNQTQFTVGRLDFQKHQLLHDIAIIQNKISILQDTLTKEYGSYDVNMEDGTINWPKEKEESKDEK